MDIRGDLIVYSTSQDHNKTTKKLNHMLWLLTSLQFQPYLELAQRVQFCFCNVIKFFIMQPRDHNSCIDVTLSSCIKRILIYKQ